jgi:hypothetical protein
MKCNPQVFRQLGDAIVGKKIRCDHQSIDEEDRRFRSMYGCNWRVAAGVWDVILEHGINKKKEKKHLLWALLWLKHYTNEQSIASILRVTCKTLRKWVWIVIEDMSNASVIKVSSNFFYFIFIFYASLLLLISFVFDSTANLTFTTLVASFVKY